MQKNILYAGVELASASNKVCLLNSDGERIGSIFSVTNNRPGTNEILEQIHQMVQKYGFQEVILSMEATNNFWQPLCYHLEEAKKELEFDMQIYLLNPKLTASHKESMQVQRDKDDFKDAEVIADRTRIGRLPNPFFSPKEEYLSLQKLTRYRFHLVKNLARQKTYFISQLFLKFSEYERVKPFSNTFGVTSSSVITEFKSSEEIVQMELSELVDFLSKKGKNRFSNPEKIAKTIKEMADNSYKVPKALLEPLNYLLQDVMTSIRFHQKQLKRVDEKIKSLLNQIQEKGDPAPNILLSISGIGPVITAGIISEIVNISRFHNQASLGKFIGLTWKKKASGNFQADDTPISKAGNSYLRYYIVEGAISLKNHNQEYSKFYKRKYKEASTHKHKRAAVLTGRKFARLVFTLLSKNELYNANFSKKLSETKTIKTKS